MRFDCKVSSEQISSLPSIQRDVSQVVIPTQFVLFNLSAILGSAILYGDFRTAKFHQFVTFMYGCAATFAGVWIIAWAPTPNEPSTGPNGASNDTETPTDGYGLFVPDCAHPGGGVSRKPGNVPILESRRSTVSLVGISPAQVRPSTRFTSKNRCIDSFYSASYCCTRHRGLRFSSDKNLGLLGKRNKRLVDGAENAWMEVLDGGARSPGLPMAVQLHVSEIG